MMRKPFRIYYTTCYRGPQHADIVIEARTQIEARFVFSELYPGMKFKKATFKKPHMKSPITGRSMPKKTLYSYLVVNGKAMSCPQEFYYCEKARHRFTDSEMDRRNYKRLHKVLLEARSELKEMGVRVPKPPKIEE